ncbi:LLM class flavin-dependent oxidoreductase [Salibacterium halotolerans]|uniref:Luciferase family oxidoreductase, group 1 n=1 Tax=Salibacterium halotolerans TaxID=1884432 RepID=A0A1I5XAS6_9BACI|nr:LLM class flavin-dependent oxidoreductase [Salibacterium halotolerans]SFQ29083.1 luciferase family oxidoreductase, group 1 [Salibacterium halotolerans]
MRLSILDQSPVLPGRTSKQALEDTVELARMADQWGFARFWITEHHDITGIAGSVPEVLLPLIGSRTSTIRIGTGALLLPHYKPFKVAEIHNMLATLFPERVDIGIGRAPGGSAEAAGALSDNFLQNVGRMHELTQELLQFLEDDYPSPNPYAPLSASPVPDTAPVPWMLGTSKKSAVLAAELGTAYAFAAFMSDNDAREIILKYREHFTPGRLVERPDVITAVSAVCAPDAEQAERTADETCRWNVKKDNAAPVTKEEERQMEAMKADMIIGDPGTVKEQLEDCRQKYGADEIMLFSSIPSWEKRKQSFQLIAEATG